MMAMNGRRNTLRYSTFKDGAEVDFLRLFGVENHIHDNTFRNNYSSDTVNNHPDFIQTFGNNGELSYGHILERNLVADIPVGQILQVSPTGGPDIRDWTFRNNVFANAALGGGGSTPGIRFYNNVFYRIASPISFGSRNFGYRKGLNEQHPVYPLCTQITPSGSLVAEGDGGQNQYGAYYEVKSFEVIVGQDTLEAGRTYRARTRGTGYVLYNGNQYTNTQTFVAQPGVTTWQELAVNPADLESVLLYPHGTVVYDGRTIVAGANDVTFQVNPAVRTYTSTWPEKVGPWRMVRDSSHRGEVIGNVFLECGSGGANTGWYNFEAGLKDCIADYNYVAGAGFTPKIQDALARPIGAPGGWGTFMWYEPNGINGGDPKFVDFSRLDFRLLTGSPLIDQGVTISGVTSDFLGTIRPLGAAADIGAFEYDDGSPPPDPPTPGAPPAAPSGLTAVSTSPYSINLAWTDNANNEGAFVVDWSLNGSSWTSYPPLAANTTTFVAQQLTPSTLYYFRVCATNGDGGSAYAATATATTQAIVIPEPDAPTGVSAIAIGAHSIAVVWTDNSDDETGFEIERSSDGIVWGERRAGVNPNATSWTDTGLPPLTTYYYRVRAEGVGPDSPWAEDTAATTAATPPSTPLRRARQQVGIPGVGGI
jgi:hypothetical protein